MKTCPRIVIIGGGASGLELATKLGNQFGKKKRAHITLIDADLTHVWKPLFHEVAVGTLDSHNHSTNFISHAQANHYHFQLGRMKNLNQQKKIIYLDPMLDTDGECILPEREVSYDYLIMAVGSVANTFQVPGAQTHCSFLDSRNDAEHFHQRFINQVIRMRQNNDTEPLAITIIGGGASGVELAAELMTALRAMQKSGIMPPPNSLPRITLIEAGQRILTMLPEKMASHVHAELTKLDIQVMTNERVTAISKNAVETASGKSISSNINVWVAGIKAPAWLSTLEGLETNARHQIKVKQSLQTTQDNNIFAMGDCAECIINSKTVPARAQAAHQQADHLYRSLNRILQHKNIKNYQYVDYGSLVHLSGASSKGFIMGNFARSFSIEGKLARLVYWLLYKTHQIKIHGTFRGICLIISNLFNSQTKPRLKLH